MKKKAEGKRINVDRPRMKVKAIIYDIIGLIFLALTFTISWMFIIGCAVVIWLAQKELMKSSD